jgi:hypothetical protein
MSRVVEKRPNRLKEELPFLGIGGHDLRRFGHRNMNFMVGDILLIWVITVGNSVSTKLTRLAS